MLFQSSTELLKQEPEYFIDTDEVNLPDDEKMVTIMGDENLLKKAFVNLMHNACKYSTDKKVFLKLFTSDKFVNIEFTDNGMGIPKNEIDRIFTAFFKGNNFTGKQGHGLGLTLAKNIIELHNGTIKVESTLNKGSKFTVTLPTIN